MGLLRESLGQSLDRIVNQEKPFTGTINGGSLLKDATSPQTTRPFRRTVATFGIAATLAGCSPETPVPIDTQTTVFAQTSEPTGTSNTTPLPSEFTATSTPKVTNAPTGDLTPRTTETRPSNTRLEAAISERKAAVTGYVDSGELIQRPRKIMPREEGIGGSQTTRRKEIIISDGTYPLDPAKPNNGRKDIGYVIGYKGDFNEDGTFKGDPTTVYVGIYTASKMFHSPEERTPIKEYSLEKNPDGSSTLTVTSLQDNSRLQTLTYDSQKEETSPAFEKQLEAMNTLLIDAQKQKRINI